MIDSIGTEAKVTKRNHAKANENGMETRRPMDKMSCPLEVTFCQIHDLINEAMSFKTRNKDTRDLVTGSGQRRANSVAFKITEFLGAILAWKLLDEARDGTPEAPATIMINRTILSSDIRTLAESLHEDRAVPSGLRDIIGRSLALHSALLRNEKLTG